MGLSKVWNDSDVISTQDNELRDLDVRVTMSPQGPVLLARVSGVWIQFVARVDAAGKVPNALLALLDGTGKVPSASLQADIARLDGSGKLPSAKLPEAVALLGNDGRLPLGKLPISIAPAFDILVAKQTGPDANSTTGLAFTQMSVPVTAGKCVAFRAHLVYGAEDGCGVRFVLDGPKGEVVYNGRFPSTSNGSEEFHANSFLEPVAPTRQSDSAARNLGEIMGAVTPDADGYLVVKFASGTQGEAVTVKEGSFLYTEQFYAAV